jgi:Tat protein translocase TatB subunit
MDIFSNIGSGELILVLIIILLVMGPHRLPEITRMLGQALRKIRETYQEFVSEFEEELHTAEKATKEVREGIQTLKEVADLPTTLLKTTTKIAIEEKPAPELTGALPTHNLTPREEAEEDSLSDG